MLCSSNWLDPPSASNEKSANLLSIVPVWRFPVFLLTSRANVFKYLETQSLAISKVYRNPNSRPVVCSSANCVIVSRHLPVAKALADAAARLEIAIFRTPMVTMRFINAATIGLEMDFAPVTTEHGSMVDIMGIGTMVRGSSGVGKSEGYVGLIERG